MAAPYSFKDSFRNQRNKNSTDAANAAKALNEKVSFLEHLLKAKTEYVELLEQDAEKMRQTEKLLRAQVKEKAEAKSENEFCHKALSQFETLAFCLCEENKQHLTLLESMRENEARLLFRLEEFERNRKAESKTKVANEESQPKSSNALNSNSSTCPKEVDLRSSESIVEKTEKLIGLLQVVRDNNNKLQDDTAGLKSKVEGLKIESDIDQIQIESLQNQIGAMEMELKKLNDQIDKYELVSSSADKEKNKPVAQINSQSNVVNSDVANESNLCQQSICPKDVEKLISTNIDYANEVDKLKKQNCKYQKSMKRMEKAWAAKFIKERSQRQRLMSQFRKRPKMVPNQQVD